ncbi:MAG TPA: zinc-binding dehydrogenase [Mycobacteriales bacterium]|nr:zinc-binding dehydrogenase [Mycobacteriales bacterium]
MLAVSATSQSDTDPLSGLTVGEVADPEVPDGWTKVAVKAAALNHHDLWSLRGVGLSAEQLPMILGCDAAGIDADGREVIVHAVIADADAYPDETLDPKRSLLSEKHQGAMAEQVIVPARNVVPKPADLSWEEAACLPTAWLTAYRMLFTKGEVREGTSVLIQGAGGGVATAAIVLAKAAGATVYVTSRDEAKRARALEIGADVALESGGRVPDRVDAVMETVGQATWGHSLKSLKPGGKLVVSGATSGPNPPADLNRVFFLQLSVLGSTMGTRDELEALCAFLAKTGTKPLIDSVRPMTDAASAFAQMHEGETFGKLVLTA